MALPERVQKLVEMGRLEMVEGEVAVTGSEWLARAEGELPGVKSLLDAKQFRLSYNAAYDVYRHAAEALLIDAGVRVKVGAGAHEVTSSAADAIAASANSPFSGATATQIRNARNSLEYIDPSRATDVASAEAEWAFRMAQEAVSFVRLRFDE